LPAASVLKNHGLYPSISIVASKNQPSKGTSVMRFTTSSEPSLSCDCSLSTIPSKSVFTIKTSPTEMLSQPISPIVTIPSSKTNAAFASNPGQVSVASLA